MSDGDKCYGEKKTSGWGIWSKGREGQHYPGLVRKGFCMKATE